FRFLRVVRPGRIFEPPPTSVLSLRRHVSTSHKAPPTEELQKAMDDFRRSQEDARTANERIKALEEQLQQMRESQDRRTPTPPDTAIDAVDSLFKWFGLDDFRVFVVWVAVTSTAIWLTVSARVRYLEKKNKREIEEYEEKMRLKVEDYRESLGLSRTVTD
ncbi:unnamed protein product, partial [Vitrella brassicaformis CCMP3155]